MMIKKLLVVCTILSLLSVMYSRAVIDVNDIVTHKVINRFFIGLVTKSTELPDTSLLQTALAGYELLKKEQLISRPEVITIIDFGLPSDKERLWVLDLINSKVLFHCLVSHGCNSGELMAENFSNNPGSYASSPGFYATGETYMGKHGLSLAFDGLEKGINDKANLKKICEEQLKGKYSIEVIDLLLNPHLGNEYQILALPTLVRKLPEPVRKIIGDLSNTERVLVGLDLMPAS